MRVVIILFLSTICCSNLWAQAAYVNPVPTNVNQLARIYVDVSQPDCNCPNLQDASEEDPIYMWTWSPSEPTVGNGLWNNSNEEMKMQQDSDNPKLWYMEVIITEFYGVDEATAYENGLSYLVKKKDGLSGGSNETENKSNDFNVSLIAPPCEDKVCPHPQVVTDQDYFTLYYDIAQEPNSNFNPDSLINAGNSPLSDGDVLIHLKAITNLGNVVQNASQSSVWLEINNNYRLIWDEDQHVFYYTFIPKTLLEINEEETIVELQVTFIKNIDPSGLLPSLWRTDRETYFLGCN
tara:strand:- start:1293 stop:2171 length:879 start_codon:yes stop_codon:yes gene_type:complete